MFVAIPSLTFNALDRLGISPYDYYSYPWEHQADIYGGVNSNTRNYDAWAGNASSTYDFVVNMMPIP